MSAPSADPGPLSSATLAVALGRGDAPGLLAAHAAYGPDLIGYAQFVLAGRPAGTPVALADEAAGAVRDALLVATGAAGDLTDPTRMLAWLLALTRNECLRRRPGAGVPASVEAAELGRRGVGPEEVAALLGVVPASLPARQAATETVPAWLVAELMASAGPDGAEHRAELTHRARPFDPDGFPVPLDRRRLSRSALAWWTAAAVLVALVVLVSVPTRGGSADAVPGLSGGPLLAAVSQAAVSIGAPEKPLQTLAEAAFRSPPVVRPPAAADRGGARPEPSATPTPAPTGGAAPTGGDGAARRSGPLDTLTVSWSPQEDPDCAEDWTARLYVTVDGGTQVSRVVASAGDRATVVLQRDGTGWSGTLPGLPTDRSATVTVSADGPVKPASQKLGVSC